MRRAAATPRLNADAHHIWLPLTLLGTTFEDLSVKLGFRFTGRVEKGQREVFMPLGWSMVVADAGSYHLLDDLDRKRAVITHEYDRDQRGESYAVLWLRRYGITLEERWDGDTLTGFKWKVVDSGLRLLREGEWIDVPDGEGMDESITAVQDAAAWLYANKPQWEDPFAYWDD